MLQLEILHDEKDEDSDRNVIPMRFSFLGGVIYFISILFKSMPLMIVGFVVFVGSFFFYKSPKRNRGYIFFSQHDISVMFNNKKYYFRPEDIKQLTLYYGGYKGFLRVFPRKLEGGDRNFIFMRNSSGEKKIYRIIIPTKDEYLILLQLIKSAKYNFCKQETPEQEAALWQLMS